MAKVQRVQISRTLSEFYNKPVAKVSSELMFSIVAVIFFALFAIKPTLVTMSDLIKEIQDKKTLNQQLAQKVASLSTLQTEYSTLQDRLPLLDEAIPSSPQFVQAIKMIEKIASEQHLVINSLQATEIPKELNATASGDVTTQNRINRPLTLTVIGDYESIRLFVEQIGNLRRVFIIDSVVFSTTEENGQKKLRGTITINLEYFGDQ